MGIFNHLVGRRPILYYVWVENCVVCARVTKHVDLIEEKAGRFVEVRRLHVVGAEETMGVRIESAPALVLKLSDGRVWTFRRGAITSAITAHDIYAWLREGLHQQEAS